MGTKQFLSILLCIVLIQFATSHPSMSNSDSSEEDFSQQQQQQSIDFDSLEKFTQKIQAKGRRQHISQAVQVQQPEVEEYDPCMDPKKVGPCKAYIPRYFFNQASGSCEMFGWGGCGKNGNNFRELSECETSCSKRLAKPNLDVRRADQSSVVETCEKPPVQGNVQCMAYIPRWTYNSTDRNCVEFIWGGCAKTDNNFATETLCRTTCAEYPNIKDGHTETTTQRQPNPVISPRESENICDLPSESGMCLALFEKYYFNKIHNRCEKFNYGGCGGNKNRFDTAEECVRACGGDSPANDIQCSDVECPWALYEHYVSLSCSPIYDGDACCPTRYECPEQHQNNTLEARSLTLDPAENTTSSTTATPEIIIPQKCRYRGRYYAVGEMVEEASDTGSCRAGCICTDSSPESRLGPRIMCAQIECPEQLSGRPRGKEHCYPLYKKGSCCAYDYYCPEDGLVIIDPSQPQHQTEKPPVAKCNVDGEGYYEGQRVYPKKSPCSKCLCQRNPANDTSLEGQLHCEKVDCGIEIHYSHRLASGCVPVYFEREDGTTSCCPISWECPKEEQQEPDYEDITTPATETERPPSTDFPMPPPPPSPPAPVANLSTSSLTRSSEACTMELDAGDCKGHRTRFHFNGTSQKCETFVYTGCNGNLNNFPSLEDCRDLCEPRSPSRGLLGRSSLQPWRSPEPKAISLTEVDPCTQRKYVGRCKGAFPRFYYSPEDHECKLFLFGGCRPNANNFYSKDACEAQCLNKIQVENLKTNVPVASLVAERRLDGGDASRVNFEDDSRRIGLHNVRRPVSQSSSEEGNPCTLPPRTGKCKAYVRRYYFDKDANTCKSFTYGGCSGNANNFHTMDDCNQQCSSSGQVGLHARAGSEPRSRLGWRHGNLPSDTAGANRESQGNDTTALTAKCVLPKAQGSCYSSIRSYHYDVETKTCKMFFYSGCFGNANRFSTQDDCENQCKTPLEVEESRTPVTTTARPGRPQIHELGASVESHSSEEQQKEDKKFCKLDPSPGNCKANYLRYYYDTNAEQCLPFVFTGCDDNKNNFKTESECMSTCGTKPTLEQLAESLVLSCTFGNTTVPLGGTISAHQYHDEEPPCGTPICQCITPPAISCIQRMCPEPTTTTTTTEEPKRCATPVCLHFCRQAIGQDGCPTCDCDFTDQSQPQVVTKYVPPPKSSVKG